MPTDRTVLIMVPVVDLLQRLPSPPARTHERATKMPDSSYLALNGSSIKIVLMLEPTLGRWRGKFMSPTGHGAW
jgi:hypothetical protein